MSHTPTPRYPLESDVLLLDLYRLAAIVLASRSFRTESEAPSSHHDPLGSLAAYFEEPEVFRILLAAAIWLRVQLDQGHLDAPHASAVVGSLRTDPPAGPKQEDLTIREACNKIIHGKGFRIAVAETDDYEQYLAGQITFTGTHRGSAWEATVDILAFVRAANPHP